MFKAAIVFKLAGAVGIRQGFGSGSALDPHSAEMLDPDPHSECGSGSRCSILHLNLEKFSFLNYYLKTYPNSNPDVKNFS